MKTILTIYFIFIVGIFIGTIKDFGDMLSIVEERAPIHKGVTIEEVGDCVTFLFSSMSSE